MNFKPIIFDRLRFVKLKMGFFLFFVIFLEFDSVFYFINLVFTDFMEVFYISLKQYLLS